MERALNRDLIDPARVVREVEAGFAGGAALLSLTRDPLLAVRQAATYAAATSGDPDAIANLEELAQRG